MAISFDNISPKLDKILEQTYGQLIFQEQVTEIAQQLAGWTAGQADKLRKAIGRKIPEEMAELIPKLHKAFVDYGKITDEQADMLCTGIQNCASYSFNKCLAGDECVMLANSGRSLSLAELYKIKLSYLYAETRNQSELYGFLRNPKEFYRAYSLYDDYTFTTNLVINIEFAGIQELYRVTLSNATSVTCTKNHKFPTFNGEKTLEELSVGDYLLVQPEPNTTARAESRRIVKIEFAGVDDTYSVEMNSPWHTFVLGSGIVSSNSHSVEYGLIAYMTAYLKANYPLEYMCALLNANSDSEEDIVKYKAECERMGIEILPPSVKVGNLNYIPENGNIRMGLNSIKGINDLKTDFFANFDDYISKNVNFNKRIKEALIKSGACDCFGLSRKEMLLRALNVYKDIKAYDTKISNSYAKLGTKKSELQEKKDGTKIKANLAKQIENLEVTIARYTKERDVLVGLTKGEYNEVEGEKEVLGFTFQDEFKYYDTSKFPLYSERVSGVQTFWANIISVKTIKDKNGNLMAFVSAVPYKHKQKVEFVVFASTYKKITTPIVEGVALLKVNKKNQLVDWVEGKNV